MVLVGRWSIHLKKLAIVKREVKQNGSETIVLELNI